MGIKGKGDLGKLLRWNTPCLSGGVLSLGSYPAPRPDRQGILGSVARALNPHGDWLSGDQAAWKFCLTKLSNRFFPVTNADSALSKR